MKGFKQITAIFIIINFIIFNVSCMVTKVVMEHPRDIKKNQKPTIIVTAVQKISGEKSHFFGKIINDRVVGVVGFTMIQRIKSSQIKSVVDKNGLIEQIRTIPGATINCAFAMKNAKGDIFYIPQEEKITHISIPLEEVELIWVQEKKIHPGRTFLVVLVLGISVGALIFLLNIPWGMVWTF